MKTLKRKGPRTDTRSTPVLMLHLELKYEPILVRCF